MRKSILVLLLTLGACAPHATGPAVQHAKVGAGVPPLIVIDSTLTGKGSTAAPLGEGATAVTPGSYTATNLTVDQHGRITAAANGSSGGITGSGTTGDLTAWSSSSAVTNFAGSSPSACSAGQAITGITISASGALSPTCTAVGTITGSGTSGDLMKFSGTTGAANYAGSSPSACTTGQAITGIAISAAGALSPTCTTIAVPTIATTPNVLKGDNAGNAVASGIADTGSAISTSEPVTLSGGAAVTGGASTDALTTGVIAPAAPGTTQNDWGPTNLAGAQLIQVTNSANTTINGIVAPTVAAEGRQLCLENIGTGLLTIANQAAASTAANRFSTVNALSWIMTAGTNESLCFFYDATAARWTQVGTFTMPQLNVGGASGAAFTVTNAGVATATRLVVGGATGATSATMSFTNTAQTGSFDVLDLVNSGSANTTAATRQLGGLNCSISATRSTGANPLVNLCGFFTAINGQTNIALQTNDGDILLGETSGNVRLAAGGGTVTIDGATTVNAALTADSTHRVIDAVSGTGLTQTANVVSLNTGNLNDLIYGTGNDGTLTFDGTTTILGLAPSSNVYTLTRSINAANITINSGVTVKTSGWQVAVSGATTNNGTISNDGGAGGNGSSGTPGTGGAAGSGGWYGGASAGGSGGTNGGVGQVGVAAAATGATSFWTTGAAGTAAGSSAGGAGGACSGGGGGAESTISGGAGGLASASSSKAAGLGTPEHFVLENGLQGAGFSTTTTFGAGGGGGAGAASSGGGGGGGGGGALWWATRLLAGTGSIHANGGAGGNGGGTTAGAGGGGGGGFVIVVYSTNTGTQTITATGGAPGTVAGAGLAGGAGGTCGVFKFNLSGDGT